jgi:hypothetical protein
MDASRIRAAAAIALVAGVTGCGGGGDHAPKAAKGKVVRGETETGMKLTVETFVDPASDPELAKLDAYRAAAHYEPVDYHRVIADNTGGARPDSGRLVTFAASAEAIAAGQGVPTRFSCDTLNFEWRPADDAPATTVGRYRSLLAELCSNGPPKQDGVAPGKRQVYFLITSRGFEERGLERDRVFGPSSAELRP